APRSRPASWRRRWRPVPGPRPPPWRPWTGPWSGARARWDRPSPRRARPRIPTRWPSSDHLGLGQELHRLRHALLRILDDLPRPLLEGVVHRLDTLGRRYLVARQPEVGEGQLVHWLLLGLHDALQRRIARLRRPGRHP